MSFINKLISGADKRVEMPLDLTDGMYREPAKAQDGSIPFQSTPPKPKRIGEMPPVAYIASAYDNLSKLQIKYSDELANLDADIAKLTEERRQLYVAIQALASAVTVLDADNHAPMTTSATPGTDSVYHDN